MPVETCSYCFIVVACLNDFCLIYFPAPCIYHRISITFRKMDETKQPIGFVPEPDLQGIQPLSYEGDKSKKLNSPKSEPYMKRQPFGKELKMEARGFVESGSQSAPRLSTRSRREHGNKRGSR